MPSCCSLAHTSALKHLSWAGPDSLVMRYLDKSCNRSNAFLQITLVEKLAADEVQHRIAPKIQPLVMFPSLGMLVGLGAGGEGLGEQGRVGEVG